MTDPVTLTAAGIAAIAASKFVEAAAGKAAEITTPAMLKTAGSQIEALWKRIKQHFTGNKRMEKAITRVEQEKSEAALEELEICLAYELRDPENQQFAEDVQQMAQQIINIGQQNQVHKEINVDIEGHDNSRNYGFGEFHGTANFGDSKS
ncbi:MAG: hypothetical protein ACTS2F_00690 [Thainema sp.]